MRNSGWVVALMRGATLLLCSALAGPVVAADFTFTPTGSMARGRAWHTATLLPNGRVLIFGGSGTVSPGAELYDPTSGSFGATGHVIMFRDHPTATLLVDGKVLITGGLGGIGYLATAELYDSASGSFTATGRMAAARYGHTATLLANGKVLIAGGAGDTGQLSSAELYDPASGSFTATGSMAESRNGHIATRLSDGKVLIAGGSGITGELSSAELYDPATGSFTATGSMIIARAYPTATPLADGKVLIAGGSGNTPPFQLSSAELYDPATGTFAITGDMTAARHLHSATALADGRVLIAGGETIGSAFLATAELYDPASGSFAAAGGSMTVDRTSHSATALADGKVLIAGGDSRTADFGSLILSSAELYGAPQPPIADAGADQNIYLGRTATLSGAASSDPGGASLTYTWALDAKPSGSTATLSSATDAAPTLVPDVIGQYVISLVVNNGTRSSAADTVLVNVSRNLPPVPVASATPVSGYPPLAVAFNASSSTDPEGGPLTYVWNFGDGSATSISANPSHSYASVGSYTALLTVTDDFGNSEQASVLISVVAPNMPPSAAPTALPSSGAAPLGVQFTANALDPEGSPLSYSWNFGDGSAVSALANPSYTYASPGVYSAALTVSDGTYFVTSTLTISVGSALAIDVTEARVRFGRPGKVEGKVDLRTKFTYPGTPSGVIRVVFDGVTLLDVPFADFKREKPGEYAYHARNVQATIDLKRSSLSVSRHRMLLAGIDNANGIDVVISFGASVATDHFVMHEHRHQGERSLSYESAKHRLDGDDRDRSRRNRD